jgi:uncharacterized phage protein (TIGR01671 family)
MNKNKFRIWNHKDKRFAEMDLPQSQQQCIGILDKNLREIYERDVVKFFTLNGEELGEVQYHADYCSYVIYSVAGFLPFMNISLDSLEVVGNMIEDYMYDENGELVKYEIQRI